MITKKNKDIFFQTVSDMYPEDRTDLIRSTPWQLLIAVVMSAQTTDKQVNKVTASFFDTIETPYDTIKLSLEQRSTLIRGVNYAPTKAKNLYKTAQLLIRSRHPALTQTKGEEGSEAQSKDLIPKDYKIPDTLSELIKLHGVGEKTAKVVLHVLYHTDDIAVDTHVHRVCNRIGLVKTNSPLQTSKLLDKAVPDKYKSIAHHALIFFGRYQCTARHPKCQTCPFIKFCIYYNS